MEQDARRKVGRERNIRVKTMLTSAQSAALAADIAADPELGALTPSSNSIELIMAAYNAPASPDFWVVRSSVTRNQIVDQSSTDPDGTTIRFFIWAGNGFISRSQGERDAWREIWNHDGAIDPSTPGIKQAFLDIFSGTGNAASNRQHLSNMARRKATRAEKLFSTGVGSAADPATMGFEGAIRYQDVLSAMGW